MSQWDNIKESMRDAIAEKRIHVIHGRRWPPTWDGTGSVLLRAVGRDVLTGHGGLEQVRYRVDCVLRVETRLGDAREDAIIELIDTVRGQFHNKDTTDFTHPPTNFHKVEIVNALLITDGPSDDAQTFIEATLPVDWIVFE